jgi:NitT/TauT family transport system ATP-binding protein
VKAILTEDVVLEVKEVHHWFREAEDKVLFDVNLRVIRGEIEAVVGPSGCGKSTLLRAILGTHPPRQGQILVNGIKVKGPGRDKGIVYQRYSLYPFLTAKENVAFGLMFDQTSPFFRAFKYLKWRKLREKQIAEAVELLGKLGLGNAINLYPDEMSGGMRQRVAIAQALIMKPEILLLDEPFGALDEATREDLQSMLLKLYLENCIAKRAGRKPLYTILIVTHELNEAIYVGDRVIALSPYWNWQANFAKAPGATIVYDQMAPVFPHDYERRFEDFIKQRDEIRAAAFDPTIRQDREQFLLFWEQYLDGMGKGVLENENQNS